jgi:apolipoprotein D and lipocalin family protein
MLMFNSIVIRKGKRELEVSMKTLFSLALTLFWLGCAHAVSPVTTVDFVEIEKYMGKWYEIGRLPQTFQRNCGATTAEYSLRRDGRVNVLNSCKRIDREGSVQSAKAIARVVNRETNAELSVSFVPLLRYFGFFGGDYWILELGSDYEYALVGSPNRKSLWILSRTPTMNEETIDYLLKHAKDQGFPVKAFELTPNWK